MWHSHKSSNDDNENYSKQVKPKYSYFYSDVQSLLNCIQFCSFMLKQHYVLYEGVLANKAMKFSKLKDISLILIMGSSHHHSGTYQP